MVYRFNGELKSNKALSDSKICTRCKCSKSITEFSINRSARDGRYIWCKDCKYMHNQKTKEQRNSKQKEWNEYNKTRAELKRLERREKRLEVIWNLKSAPCTDCGGNFHPYCMDFDHRDQSIKYKDISQINRIDEILEEVKKCDLVCANCHRIRTFNRFDSKYQERKKYLESINNSYTIRPDTELIHDHKANLADQLDTRI